MATKTGCSTVAGSHQPRSSAAVRQVKTADGGKINRHATSSAAGVGESARGTYSPRDTRRQRRDRVVPRNGIDSASTADVTPGRCLRMRKMAWPHGSVDGPTSTGRLVDRKVLAYGCTDPSRSALGQHLPCHPLLRRQNRASAATYVADASGGQIHGGALRGG